MKLESYLLDFKNNILKSNQINNCDVTGSLNQTIFKNNATFLSLSKKCFVFMKVLMTCHFLPLIFKATVIFFIFLLKKIGYADTTAISNFIRR